jgi:hypothetical protein
MVYELILKRILAESAALQTEGLAICSGRGFNAPDTIFATLYDPALLKKKFSENVKPAEEKYNFFKEMSRLEEIFSNETIKGYIVIKDAAKFYGPCNGAWSVAFSAGKGYGRTLYGAAYALSPSKILMSDRLDVSSSAKTGWKKAYDSGRKKKALDSKKPPHKTPDDPSDDCILYNEKGLEFLDYTYEAEGWEEGLLNTLISEHESNISELIRVSGMERKELERNLENYGMEFFGSKYHG